MKHQDPFHMTNTRKVTDLDRKTGKGTGYLYGQENPDFNSGWQPDPVCSCHWLADIS